MLARPAFALLSAVLALAVSAPAALAQPFWSAEADMPVERSNNAAAYYENGGKSFLLSCAGIDGTKIFSGIHNDAWIYDIEARAWTQAPDLPGPPVIAASASALRGKVYVAGGYQVFANGDEVSQDSVRVYDPAANSWSLAPPTPLPIDDHVQLVRGDRWLYLVSGWSGPAGDPNPGNVGDVQVYDADADAWSLATDYPVPVFGHSGCLIGDSMYIFDGVTDFGSFTLQNIVLRGDIDPADPLAIDWVQFNMDGSHAGAKGYRMGASAFGPNLLLVGGSGNPYNFDGIGYNGTPSEPLDRALLLDPADASELPEQTIPAPPTPVMDLRGLAWSGSEAPGENFYWLVGGMASGQQVTNKVQRLTIAAPAAVENWADFE